jgi:hypothetical protein
MKEKNSLTNYTLICQVDTMATLTLEHSPTTTIRQGFPPQGSKRVYSIVFDLQIDLLRVLYGDPYNGAYL